MHKKFINIILWVGISLTFLANNALAESFADVVARVTPAVVNISVVQKANKAINDMHDMHDMMRELLEHYMGGRMRSEPQRKVSSLGSGFLINEDGYIVTNHHVIDGADEIKVKLHGGIQTYNAKLIGKDEKTDMALIKIKADKPLPYLVMDDSKSVRVGDSVIAVGNPFGLGGTVTSGIISAKSRHLGNASLADYIQTDAAINRGNSGGPLCSAKTGKVIGVNSAILTTNGGSLGIGFAVPTSVATSVIKQLQKTGKVKRGWLGVMIQEIDEGIVKALKLSKRSGAVVVDVIKDSPADKAAINAGDIILSFNGFDVKDISSLSQMAAAAKIGEKAELLIIREGKIKKLPVIIESLPDAKQNNSDKDNISIIGIKVSDIDEKNRRKYRILDKVKDGVIVTTVSPNSVADKAGIRAGDLILLVGQQQIKGQRDFYQKMQKLIKKRREIALLVMRDTLSKFIVIEVENH